MWVCVSVKYSLSCWRGSLYLSSIPVIHQHCVQLNKPRIIWKTRRNYLEEESNLLNLPTSGWHTIGWTTPVSATMLRYWLQWIFLGSLIPNVDILYKVIMMVCVCVWAVQSVRARWWTKGHLRYWPIKLTYLTFYGVSWQMALIISVTLFIITLNYRKTSTHTHTHAPS